MLRRPARFECRHFEVTIQQRQFDLSHRYLDTARNHVLAPMATLRHVFGNMTPRFRRRTRLICAIVGAIPLTAGIRDRHESQLRLTPADLVSRIDESGSFRVNVFWIDRVPSTFRRMERRTTRLLVRRSSCLRSPTLDISLRFQSACVRSLLQALKPLPAQCPISLQSADAS